jgi:hypothetical protein
LGHKNYHDEFEKLQNEKMEVDWVSQPENNDKDEPKEEK